jgi:hypothetical protein
MKARVVSLTKSVLGLGVGALLCASISAQAATVTLNLDSTQSYLDATGNAFTLNFGPQGAGSMRDYFGGTITADLTAGVFTFTGGSSIVGLLNPAGPFIIAPTPGGPIPGNYGVKAGPTFITGYGLVTVNGSYGGMALDLTGGGTAQNGLASSGLTPTWTAGVLTWGAYGGGGATPIGGGTSSLVGVNGPNTSASLVSWDGNTLILPVTFHTTGSNRYEDWTGQLVAVVPEPSSLVLVGFGLLGLVSFRRLRTSFN